jgi:hypothetical protein
MKGVRFAIPVAFAGAMLLAACQDDPTDRNIPTAAGLVTSGNSNLAYTTQYDGMVWVYEAKDNHLVYSGPVLTNQSVIVNTDSNEILINGRVVAEKILDKSSQHRIYFQQGTRQG